MPGRALLVVEDLLGTRLQVDDAVVLAVAPVDVLLHQQPAAALVDLAFVEVALAGDERGSARGLVVGDAADVTVVAVLDRGRVHAVVVARMELPDAPVAAEMIADVEHRLHGASGSS